MDHRRPEKAIVDTVGLLMAVYGHKAEVLVEGRKETWDISDLAKMEKNKNESR
tara:strand:- start:602 stop:760 length:159 start_codon:yes stop_codon:yes gene_type:complete